MVHAGQPVRRAGLIDADVALAQPAAALGRVVAGFTDDLAAARPADLVRAALGGTALGGIRTGSAVGLAGNASAEAVLTVAVAALVVVEAGETVGLAGAAAAEVVDAGAGAALIVAEADRAIGLAHRRAAVAVGADAAAALVVVATGAALGCARAPTAVAVLADEGAALPRDGAGQAIGLALGAAAVPAEAIEVAALDGGLAGLAVGLADLLGLTEPVLAEQIGAAIARGLAGIAQGSTVGTAVELDLVVLARSGAAGGKGYEEPSDGEHREGDPDNGGRMHPYILNLLHPGAQDGAKALFRGRDSR